MVLLQLCVAIGANVWVTSSDETKISKAIELGAKGGVNYKSRERAVFAPRLRLPAICRRLAIPTAEQTRRRVSH